MGKLKMTGSTGESDGERHVGLCGRVFDVQKFSASESVEDGDENKREGGRDTRDGRRCLGRSERYA